jgi:hypothetical protein
LKLFEPLLRYSLHLAPEQKIEFEAWQKVRGTELKKYEAVAPSLTRVISLRSQSTRAKCADGSHRGGF